MLRSLLIMLGLLVVPNSIWADETDQQAKNQKTAKVAHIRLKGLLDESPQADDPLFGSLKENFTQKLKRIEKAKDDPKIQALYLEIDGVLASLFGFGKLHELRLAIADFRASGKKAYAYMETAMWPDYLVALACDKIVMPESGDVMLVGIRAELTFFKDLFENLGIKADFLQMGDFKGASEPFTRSSMSKEYRKQFELVIDDFYNQSMVQTIVDSRPQRKWTAQQVKQLIDNGPYTASAALKAGLIEELAYPDTFKEQFKKELSAEKVDIVKDYGSKKKTDLDFSNPFAIFKMLAPPKKKTSDKPKVAIIYAIGAITTGKSSTDFLMGSTMGSDTIIKAINKAKDDDTVKAIVLRVDSPGGSALASDLIWDALQRCEKPVIASMSDIAASGGYYISMGCDRVVAEPGTLTGSIGVVGGKFVTKGLFDWAGLDTEVISRGKNAGIFSTETTFSESERKAFRRSMEEIYDMFLSKVVKNRQSAGVKLSYENLKEDYAGGRIWTGRQAKERGLVDELGTLEDAIAMAKQMAKVPEDTKLERLVLPKPMNIFEQLLEGGPFGLQVHEEEKALLGILRRFPELHGRLRHFGAMLKLRNEHLWLMAPYRLELK